MKYLVVVIIGLIAVSCSTVKVVHLSEVENLKENALIYSLPATVINVDVEVTKSIYKKGPYYDYALKYLGIEPEISSDYTEFIISDIMMYESTIPDEDQLYVILDKKGKFLSKINLSEEGILLSVNEEYVPEFDNNFRLNKMIKSEAAALNFSYASMKKNLEEIIDTSYKIVQTDSTPLRIPVYTRHKGEKNIQKKAEEAANFITKLRKRRFRMMTGMDEVLPEGAAAKTLIEELNKLEKECMHYFTGIRNTEKQVYSYSYIPVKEEDRRVLFYFSKNTGVQKSVSGARPFEILIKVSGSLSEKIDTMYSHQEKMKSYGLAYRIPEKSDVKLLYDGRLVADKSIYIPQCGVVSRLPLRLLKRDKAKVLFYSNKGMVKSVY